MNAEINQFHIVRIYADEEGDSHFQDVQIPLSDAGEIGWLSPLIPAKGLIFRTVIPGYDYDFHNAPARQYLFVLDGEIEIETSLGIKRRFTPGSVLLLEDTSGKGHRTRNVRAQIRRSVFVVMHEEERES